MQVRYTNLMFSTYKQLYRVLKSFGQELLTLEKNITLNVKESQIPNKKPLNTGRIAFSVDVLRQKEDVLLGVYWILRRKVVLAEGKTIFFGSK